jgi:hypothetical protein
VSIHYLISAWILSAHRMHQPARYLHQSRHEAAKSRSKRDAAHHKEPNRTQVNRAASLITESEWPAGNDNRPLESQWMLSAKGDGKVNGERVDAFAHLFRHLRRFTLARRGDLCALSWGHLCTAC